MTDHSIAHGTFVIERDYPHPAAKVFAAFAMLELKQHWFGGEESAADLREFDFRVGGRELRKGRMPDGGEYTFDVTYQDIVADNRIVYTYDMHIGGRRISVSLAVIELKPTRAGTHLTVTEYGAFLDGLDTVDKREGGTKWLLDKLGEWLAA